MTKTMRQANQQFILHVEEVQRLIAVFPSATFSLMFLDDAHIVISRDGYLIGVAV